VVNGINPYDYNDQKELRNFLRTDSISYNEYTSRDQDSWNFQAGAALPMATLFFGGIELFCYCILCIMLAQFWKMKDQTSALLQIQKLRF
jgi:hypothetical protein